MFHEEAYYQAFLEAIKEVRSRFGMMRVLGVAKVINSLNMAVDDGKKLSKTKTY